MYYFEGCFVCCIIIIKFWCDGVFGIYMAQCRERESNLSLVWGNSKPEYFDFFVKWHFYYNLFSAFPLFVELIRDLCSEATLAYIHRKKTKNSLEKVSSGTI